LTIPFASVQTDALETRRQLLRKVGKQQNTFDVEDTAEVLEAFDRADAFEALEPLDAAD
jgi:hypothetical protein